jgi:ribonuclease Z
MIRFVALGTGSTFPSEHRNHPAFYFEFKGTSFLFDCGEGTQRQFRFAKISPTKIDYIFLTHWHGDHSLGLPGILFNLANSEYRKKLRIFVPRGFGSKIMNLIEDFQIPIDFPIEINEIQESGKVLESSEFEIYALEVKHSVKTFAYCFKQKDYWRLDNTKLKERGIYGKHRLLDILKKTGEIEFGGKKIKINEVGYIKKGFKFTYITDTKYFDELINFAENSDILLIESTYIKDPDKASEYFHLDFDQALEIFAKSKSNIMLVTHISQRYEDAWKEIINTIESNENCYVLSDFDSFRFEKNKITLKIRNREIIYERDEQTGKTKLITFNRKNKNGC